MTAALISTNQLQVNSTLGRQPDPIREKWISANLSERLYDAEPEVAQKIMNLHLHYPCAFWSMVRLNPRFGYLEILVDNYYRDARFFLSDIKKECNKWSSISNPEQKYTCSSNGLSRHSVDWKQLPVIAQLSQEQLRRLQASARQCISPLANSQNPNCVVEICSSKQKMTSSPLLSGVENLVLGLRHSWIRITDSAGRVRSVGFCVKGKLTFFKRFRTLDSEFCTPDIYETFPIDKKYITRIAITSTQCNKLIKEIERFQNEEKRIQFLRHNCSTFAQHVLRNLGFEIQIRMSMPAILYRCMPLSLQKCTDTMGRIIYKIYRTTWILPYLFESLATLSSECFKPISNLFGEEVQDSHYFPNANRTQFYHFMLPGKIIEWQNKQASTINFPKRTPFMQQYSLIKKTS